MSLQRKITEEELEEIGSIIGRTVKLYGISAETCCESVDFEKYDIRHGSCIDQSSWNGSAAARSC